MPESSRQGKRKARSPPRSSPLRQSQRIREKTEVEPDSYFCEVCLAGLDGHLPISDQGQRYGILGYEHYRDLDSWRNAANDGCYFCALFWRRLTSSSSYAANIFGSDYSGGIMAFDWQTMNPIERKVEPKHRNITVTFTLNDGTLARRAMRFFLEEIQNYEPVRRNCTLATDGAGLGCQRSPSSSTPTEEAWSCARTWIDRCSTSHNRCSVPRDKTWHPRRLLDLRDASHKVWLIETQSRGVTGAYATLSHRWPPDFQKTLILRPETYDLLCEGIPIVRLPQTVQDSITCCTNLSIRYLWVDCMCIIQNPKKPVDWQEQASAMDKVYTHSHVNLSALTADNTESSMFQPRDALSFNGMVTASIAQKLGLSKSPRRYRVINADMWNQNVTRSHINKRAWILQERVLSPRILHFGHGQLFWECCMESATEIYPTGLPPFLKASLQHEDGELKNLDPGTQRTIRSRTMDRRRGAYQIWARIVQKYSECGLTNSSDKLVALSGLAKRIKSIVDDEYVAGMWRSHLPLQLFWVSSSDLGRRSVRPAQYRTPWFSWAAIDGTITFPSFPDRDSALAPEILGVHLRYENKDVFGAIVGGYLTLRSHLYRLLSPVRLENLGRNQLVRESQILRLDSYGNDGAIVESVISDVYLDNVVFDEEQDEQDDIDFSENFYCVPRLSKDPGIIFLLILQLIDREEAYYARRGRVSLYNSGYGPSETYETFLKRLQTTPSDPSLHYPCIAYNEGKHTIRLV